MTRNTHVISELTLMPGKCRVKYDDLAGRLLCREVNVVKDFKEI